MYAQAGPQGGILKKSGLTIHSIIFLSRFFLSGIIRLPLEFSLTTDLALKTIPFVFLYTLVSISSTAKLAEQNL